MRLHVHIFILILVCWQLTACTENAQQENQSATSNRSDSKQFATISIDDKQYTLPHVICQPPHPQTKAYTVMASEIEGDVVEGASFRSFGTPSYSTMVFSTGIKMDSDGYNISPVYNAQGQVSYVDNSYRFSGEFEKVVHGDTPKTLKGSAQVACE